MTSKKTRIQNKYLKLLCIVKVLITLVLLCTQRQVFIRTARSCLTLRVVLPSDQNICSSQYFRTTFVYKKIFNLHILILFCNNNYNNNKQWVRNKVNI